MNKITYKELGCITPILKTNNIKEDEVFDYLRIVSISNTKYEELANNPLYFITYASKEEAEDGWYETKVDLRPYINNLFKKYPNYTFVIDKTMTNNLKEYKNNKYILVDDLNKAIDDIFNYRLQYSKTNTIAITGSVGKTTTVGLIESILKKEYNVLRIYSKRITPLVLKANIINLLDKNIDYIVLENSIYYHDHVAILTDLLRPAIAAMLNIESSHLGVDCLDSLDDICMYKSQIMKYATDGYVIENDECLSKLSYYANFLRYKEYPVLYNPNLTLKKLNISDVQTDNNEYIINNIRVTPFINSELSKKQYLVAYKIAKQLGIKDENIIEGMNNYKPVENRLQQMKLKSKTIIFDGDVTTYERINELSNIYDENKYLVLRKVGSKENTFRIAEIKEHFNKFKKVFVFDDIEYLSDFIDESNVIIVNNNNFINNLEGTIVYHYSGYYRVWKTYEEVNLDIYDKEKYPILKKVK